MLSSSVYRKFGKIVYGKGCLSLAVALFVLGLASRAHGQSADRLLQPPPTTAESSAGLGSDASQPCVSRSMLRSAAVDGHRVRVGYADNGSGTGPEQGIDESRAPQTATELRRMYEVFAKAARRGEAAAQVNVAIASLAGWGTEENAGAALYWLNEASRQGYKLAYFDLGVLYQNGCGVRQDYAEAVRFFRLGAKANDAASQMNLGYLYDRGLGVGRDREQAAAWYRRAAEQGLAQAQFNLGDLYAQGEGAERNEREALVWFERAAIQGHTTAQLMLGAMYVQGRGTPQDLPTAYGWLTAARLAGDVRAEAQLRSIEPHLSAAEIAEARERAVRLVRSTAPKPTVAVLR